MWKDFRQSRLAVGELTKSVPHAAVHLAVLSANLVCGINSKGGSLYFGLYFGLIFGNRQGAPPLHARTG